MLNFRVLGTLEVQAAHGGIIRLASSSQRRLISVLCSEFGAPTSSSVLEERLGQTAGAVRTSVSRLRASAGADAVITRPSGYELSGFVDCWEFEQLVESALAADDGAARRQLEEALGLWRGRPLAEFAGEDWARLESRRLSELWAVAVEELACLLIADGEDARAISTLEPLIADHPYRDYSRALLMRALTGAGRRTEALREYQNYRTVLIEDIGTTPSDALQRLDQEIAAASGADPSLIVDPGWSSRKPDRLSTTTAGSQLPSAISSFIGRVSEVRELGDLVQASRLVTVLGPGGCGKTRLALAVAEATATQFDATWWVDLTPAIDAEGLEGRILEALGAAPASDVRDAFARKIRPLGAALLILDNAEHLATATAVVQAELLTAFPNLTVLVTSRKSLGISGEVVWRVPSLSLPVDNSGAELNEFDACALFIARATEARQGSVTPDLADRVVAVCEALDGMPLALELAAARVRNSSLDEVASGIEKAITWKRTQTGSSSDRHESLDASIQWSVDLISSQDRSTLTALSVFRSEFSGAAARQVAMSEEIDFDGSIRTLVDFSLLQLDTRTGRYRMLQTVQQYCRQRFGASSELSVASQRHASFFAQWCTEVGKGVHGIERQPLLAEMNEVVAAFEWAKENDHSSAFQILAGLASLWTTLGSSGELQSAWAWLEGCRSREDYELLWAQAVASLSAWLTVRGEDSSPLADDFLTLLPTESREAGWLARSRAMIPALGGDPDPILEYLDGLRVPIDDIEASVYSGFGAYMLALTGRVHELDPHLARLRSLARRYGTTLGVGSVGTGFAAALLSRIHRGSLTEAVRLAGQARHCRTSFSMAAAGAFAQVGLLALHEPTLDRATEWSRSGTIAGLRHLPFLVQSTNATFHGDIQAAADQAEGFLDLAPRVPVSFVQPWPILNAALLSAGRVGVAASGTATAESCVAQMSPTPMLTATIELCWAQIARYRQNHEEGERRASTVLSLITEIDFPLLVVDALELKADAALQRGDDVVSDELIQRASLIRTRTGYRSIQ